MGWFDFITKRDDPLRDLDPTLREYLEKEAPKRYKTASEAAASQSSSTQQASQPQSYREQLGLGHNDPEEQHRLKQQQQSTFSEEVDTAVKERPLPTESLYQDGRYAHIWKNYRPQQEVEDSGKSDQEKLLDIVGGYKERQAEVGRAALENCSNEQWAVHECFRSGSWSALATMCKMENRELNRCISMQSKFLRALGYLTMQQRTAEESERIQMHADRLYQRMLEEEQAEAAASINSPEQKKPAPDKLTEQLADLKLAGLALQKSADELPRASSSTPSAITFDTLPAHVRTRLEKERFAGLEGPALELAKRELNTDIAFNQEAVARLNERYRTEREERLKRLEAGEERVSDKVKRWFDFRKYDEQEAGEVSAVEEKK